VGGGFRLDEKTKVSSDEEEKPDFTGCRRRLGAVFEFRDVLGFYGWSKSKSGVSL